MNIKKYTFIIQLVLKFVGFYPINMLRYFTCIGFIILMVVTQIIMVYKKWNDLDTVLETSSTLFTIALAALKSIVWMINRKKLSRFISFMLTGYWKIIEADVFVYLQEYAIYARTISKCYFISMCNALMFYSSLPIIEILTNRNQDSNNFTMKNFPFTGEFPVSFHKFPLYEIMYAYQVVATNICGLVMLATDSLIAAALLHTCGHFAVLKQKLKELDLCIYRVTNSENNLKKRNAKLYGIKVQLMQIIEHHQIVLWFCKNMEKNFHLMLLLQTMTSSLILCFVGFQVSTAFTEHSKLVKSFSHLLVALFQLLLFCFPGDILIQKSFDISTTVYSIQWYKLPSIIKNEICMMTLRSQKPCSITAGKLYDIHLENFSTILSTAFSYFMLLQSFNSEA